MPEPYRYFVLNKPVGIVSQFRSPDAVGLLGHLGHAFPEGIHAIGRLDRHSEGLLLLTTDKRITRLLFSSAEPHRRTYVVQVKRRVTEEKLHLLRTGILIRIQGGVWYRTPPCEVEIVPPFDRFPPPRALPPYLETDWISITLTEGKYHQVRKMVAAAGHRCLRLIRTSIEDLELGDLPPGAIRELEEADFFRLLKL